MRNLLILVTLAAVVGLPFLLRPRDSLLARADETLVIITPHNEAIRYEFARGFRDWYKARTGRSVRIDWRVPGGTTEIARYLASEYQAPFEMQWRRKQKMHWDDVAQTFVRRSQDQDRRGPCQGHRTADGAACVPHLRRGHRHRLVLWRR